MCGIAGWVDFTGRNAGEEDPTVEMTRALEPRGPDDEGFWRSKNVSLGHRRLIVVDPKGGRQPMVFIRGGNTYVLVYNGELYNTEDIRLELRRRGHEFLGWSDTEVLLHAYAEWGRECLKKLNGIFAFAVWDERLKRLTLARDRLGVKPLFYALVGGGLVFASEIKAMLRHPLIKPEVSQEGLAEIFALGPARTPGHGVFSRLSELKPGYFMEFDRNGAKIEPYWALRSFPHTDDFETTADNVRQLFIDSVKRQLISDVPLCVLLSGGLDSSAIASVAAGEYLRGKAERIKTFSIDYVGNDRNFRPSALQPSSDAPWVKLVSEYLQTDHEVCLVDTQELVDSLFPAVLARDLPGMADIDSSLLLFCRWVKERATVGLSGECADEVFGGYPWFFREVESRTFPWSQHLDSRMSVLSPDLVSAIRPREYIAARYEEALSEVPRCDLDSPEDERMRTLFYLNLTRWMPTLLDRKDRMSMYSGLELRVPFCDHRLVEYVWNIPWSFKFHLGREKGLLRQALKGLLPDEVLWRKKSPYPKTHNPDYTDALRVLTLRMLDDSNAPIRPLISAARLKELATTVGPKTDIPWFGQLMNAPQLMAYLLQVNYWLKEYSVSITP